MGIGDRILTAEVACALQRESEQEGELLVWIVAGSEDEMVARPVTSGRGALPYVLVADTLEALRAQIPVGLVRATDTPADPDRVLEVCMPLSRTERKRPGARGAARARLGRKPIALLSYPCAVPVAVSQLTPGSVLRGQSASKSDPPVDYRRKLGGGELIGQEGS